MDTITDGTLSLFWKFIDILADTGLFTAKHICFYSAVLIVMLFIPKTQKIVARILMVLACVSLVVYLLSLSQIFGFFGI